MNELDVYISNIQTVESSNKSNILKVDSSGSKIISAERNSSEELVDKEVLNVFLNSLIKSSSSLGNFVYENKLLTDNANKKIKLIKQFKKITKLEFKNEEIIDRILSDPLVWTSTEGFYLLKALVDSLDPEAKISMNAHISEKITGHTLPHHIEIIHLLTSAERTVTKYYSIKMTTEERSFFLSDWIKSVVHSITEGVNIFEIEPDSLKNFKVKVQHWKNTPDINPTSTHIEELLQPTNESFNKIKKSLEVDQFLSNEERQNRISVLDSMLIELTERKNSQQITYEWYFCFNLRLSAIATPDKFKKTYEKLDFSLEKIKSHEVFISELKNTKETSYKNIFKIICEFPNSFYLFTTDSIGLSAFNQILGDDIYFLGISENLLGIIYDGILNSSLGFTFHDSTHALNFKKLMTINPVFKSKFKIFSNTVNEKINKTTSIEEKEKLQLMWFYFTHETLRFLESLNERKPFNVNAFEDSLTTSCQSPCTLGIFLAHRINIADKNAVRSYVSSAIELFSKIIETEAYEFFEIK